MNFRIVNPTIPGLRNEKDVYKPNFVEKQEVTLTTFPFPVPECFQIVWGIAISLEVRHLWGATRLMPEPNKRRLRVLMEGCKPHCCLNKRITDLDWWPQAFSSLLFSNFVVVKRNLDFFLFLFFCSFLENLIFILVPLPPRHFFP